MNFAMLPKCLYIAKIPQIYSMSAIFAHISCYASFFCTECLEAQVATLPLITEHKFSVLFLTMHRPPTTSSSAQCWDRSRWLPANK